MVAPTAGALALESVAMLAKYAVDYLVHWLEQRMVVLMVELMAVW